MQISSKILKASWLTLVASTCIDAIFLNFLLPSIVISQHLRLDRGSETGIMATIHAYLRQTHEDVDDASNTVHYGSSTNNKVTITLEFANEFYKWATKMCGSRKYPYPSHGRFLVCIPPPLRNFRSKGVFDDPPSPQEFPRYANMVFVVTVTIITSIFNI